MFKNRMVWLLACSAALFGCSETKKRVEGDRKSVVEFTPHLKIDVKEGERNIIIAEPQERYNWTQVLGEADHTAPNISYNGKVEYLWSKSVGTGYKNDARLLSTPIVADGHVYTMDTRARVRAFNKATGERLWEKDLAPESKDDPLPGGGVAYADGRVYVTSPHAEVIAIDTKTGEEIWSEDMEAPVRAAPTVAGGRVFVLSIDNNLSVFDAASGKRLWSHTGIAESAGLLGMASPAVAGNIVVVAYSSGEVYGLNTETGAELWNETLSPTRRPDALSSMAHISAHPVISGNEVIIIGHNQKMAAFDLMSGQKLWERRIGGIKSPSVVGDYVFMVNNFNEMIALLKKTGDILWIEKLESDPKRINRVMWSGPVVAGSQLYLTGYNGKISVHGLDGKKVREVELNDRLTLPPVFADGNMYILTDDGDLKVFN